MLSSFLSPDARQWVADAVFDKSFLDILACPLCKTEIRLEEAAMRFVCTRCGRRYPIRDGFPILLIEEAELPPGAAASSDPSGPPPTPPTEGGK